MLHVNIEKMQIKAHMVAHQNIGSQIAKKFFKNLGKGRRIIHHGRHNSMDLNG